MKEHPILFSGPMIRAILEDRKSQTRRVVKDVRDGEALTADPGTKIHLKHITEWWKGPRRHYHCPYGQVGDRLWVRETHYRYGKWVKNGLTKTGLPAWKFKAVPWQKIQDMNSVYYAADDDPGFIEKRTDTGWHKRPSIFLPRTLSRITLEITNVRVERLQDIGTADIEAEGITLPLTELFPQTNRPDKLRQQWQWGWDKINGKRAPWGTNPWVWVISFKQVEI